MRVGRVAATTCCRESERSIAAAAAAAGLLSALWENKGIWQLLAITRQHHTTI